MQALDHSTRQRIANRYGTRGQRLHARWKLAYDPAYAATAALLGTSRLPLLDIGCGIGLLGQYLHALGVLTEYVGLDHDPRKIAAGQAAARNGGLDPCMQLRSADVAALPSLHGHVALLDVLHYLPAARQAPLLESAAAHLAADGVLVIRNVLREPSWRFHATRVEEFFLRASGWIPGGAQHYPSAEEIRAPLEALGLAVHIESLRGRTPYNSYLIVARRPAVPD
ncbi:class I SAM-dependent methyltransferase [Dyella tabacisoli]|uniref:Methyltransferase n=1 Tax=Dyella tabacisoli TaxID=2282381 RepID=A0A369USG4_9GAMM|nr:class I SAM-dependent methyltransferase [Dyella tabacisoli]RDD83692.1 methyltransferase [Dyella tabacisoli]